MAKDTGQRAPTPPAALKKIADSSDSDEPEDKDDKPRSKKNKVGYNLLLFGQVTDFFETSDPFIDDSELAIDEHQFFAQTKQQGFYVSSGESSAAQRQVCSDLSSILSILTHCTYSRKGLPRILNRRKSPS